MATIGALVVAITTDSARFEAGMGRARKQTSDLEQAVKRLQREGLDRMTAGMTLATNGTMKWQQGLASIAAANRAAEAGLTQTARVSGSATEGFRKMQNALTDMGLGMVGLQGQSGRLAEGLLLMGAGGAVTLALTAGLAGVGLVMNKLKRDAEALRESVARVGTAFDAMRGLAEESRYAQATLAFLAAADDLAAARQSFFRSDAAAQAAYNSTLANLLDATAALNAKRQKVLEGLSQAPSTTGFGNTLMFLDALKRSLADLQVTIQGFRRGERNNLVIDATRQGASAAEEAAMVAATQARRSLAMTGVGGERGVSAASQAMMERQLQMAKFVESVWESAAQNIQSKTADVFQSIFNGQLKSLNDFALSVVKIVQQAIAQLLAAQAARALGGFLGDALGFAGGAASPGAASAGAAIAPGAAAPARGGMTVHVHYAPTVHAIDAQGVSQFFRRSRGILAGEVARVVGESSMARAAIGR